MRRLLQDLCRELQSDHVNVEELDLPVAFFQRLSQALSLESYSHWKVVGWIEALNDLVYFLDILRQWRIEADRPHFAEQLLAECEEKFFEHSYLDDLFPHSRPRSAGLEKRLSVLCLRLSRELVQESLWFDPALPVKWSKQQALAPWDIPARLDANFERAESAGTISVGLSGAWCRAPKQARDAMKRSGQRVTFRTTPHDISAKIGTMVSPIWTGWGAEGHWHWILEPAMKAIETLRGPVTVGPTLVYGKDRQPRTVVGTELKHVLRISRAWHTIQQAWPEGHEVLALFTSRLIPLKAAGVVSFSYRHRPGLSFVNCFDRDNLDLIDDLVHENSHHHLNLLLRKHVLYHGDHHQQIFYSPWRRSLRPLRGILHATFTFTMGAILFERLSVWASGPGGAARWKKAGLTTRDLQRARFRCFEEVESVRHSLQDLRYADHHLGWLTGSGRRLVGQLAEALDAVEQGMRRYENKVLHSPFGPSLRRHAKELKKARQTYGPMRLTPI